MDPRNEYDKYICVKYIFNLEIYRFGGKNWPGARGYGDPQLIHFVHEHTSAALLAARNGYQHIVRTNR